MSEPGFREIQLNTKQVVFLFIAGVAGAVAIFLLGVTVGRGVTSDRPADAVQTDPAADVKAGGAMPPATSPKPNELTYHDDLQGRGRASAPPTPPDAPPDTTTPKPTPTAPAAAAQKPKPTPTPVASPTPPAASAKTGAAYFVQVDSFSSRSNAERRVGELKAKGFVSFIFEAPGGGAKFKVRVGPFADSNAAEAMRDRLRREGYTPSITR